MDAPLPRVETISDLAAGVQFVHEDHICHIYEGAGDQLGAAVPFIKEGLAGGECCVYVVDDVELAELERELAAAGVDVAEARARGAWATIEGSGFGIGEQQVDDWLRSLGSTVSQAVSAGFSGMRIAVDMTWTLTTGANLSLVERMEAMANDLFYKGRPVVGMCQYNRARFGPEVLAGALANHPMAVIENTVYRNLHYRPPRVLFGELSQPERVEWMLDELRRQQREQRQHDELIRAQAAARARDEFLATAAHELRSPVTSIRGFVQLAQHQLARIDAPEVQQVRQMMDVVNSQTDRLARLVGELFDVSRIESGKLVLDQQPCDLAALVREHVQAAQLTTDKHHLSLSCPDSLILAIDELRFSRVLTNLLDNAVKYSPQGGAIEVHLAGGATATISIRDHGLGVPPEHRDKLFEPFYQVGEKNVSGLGLGLYLSRQIVEQHGGRLTADFPEDGGSRFVVSLPAGPALAASDRIRVDVASAKQLEDSATA